MSFPRYPGYADSGVEWLGNLPEHWKVAPLGRLALSKCDGPFGSGLKSEHYTEAGVRVVRLQNIREFGFDSSDAAYIDPQYADALGDHSVIADDILIAGLGDERNAVGRACVAPTEIQPAMVKADCFRFRPDRSIANPRFIALQLTAGASFAAGVLATGSTRSRIPLSAMSSRRVALPPLHEQCAIAAFLDRETAKIDALVDEQRRLIELLKEKRQAVISHAVTKGLDPNAPMKDSCVEWLGQVPEHWRIARVKQIASLISKGTTPTTIGAEYTSSGVRFLKAENIVEGQVSSDPEFFISPETHQLLARSELHETDVLVVIAGATTGKSAVMNESLLPANTNQAVSFVRCRGIDQATFLQAWLSTDQIQDRVRQTAVQSAQPNLSMEDLGNLPLPLPPTDEMARILTWLDHELAGLDELMAASDKARGLLQERRTALISAAVTGKIDVCGAVPATAEAA